MKKYIKRFNENSSQETTLRDLVGDIKETKKIGYHEITETTKGCLSNLYNFSENLDQVVEISDYSENIKDFIIDTGGVKRVVLAGRLLFGYFEEGNLKILSTIPGDERNPIVFNDVFISPGHDGNYLWNVKTGEFKSHTL